MRSLILVVFLVAAAFLGGAFVNGPGLQWAQARMLKSLGVGDGNEIASVDLKVTGETLDSADSAKPGPIAPAPTIIAEGSPPLSKAHQDAEPTSRTPALLPLPKKTHLDSPPAGRAPKSDDQSARTFKESGTSVDRSVLTASLKNAGYQSPSLRPAPAQMDSLPPLSPVSGSLESAPLPPSPRRAGDMGGDWAAIVRKMESFGVKRFSVEGEPGGRVLFSCLIPLAGRQAVSQRFEAEDDDVIEAARAALRRIALWRAAQDGSP